MRNPLLTLLFLIIVTSTSCVTQVVTDDFTYPHKVRVDTIHSNFRTTFLRTSSICERNLSIAEALQKEKAKVGDPHIRDRIALLNITQQKKYSSTYSELDGDAGPIYCYMYDVVLIGDNINLGTSLNVNDTHKPSDEKKTNSKIAKNFYQLQGDKRLTLSEIQSSPEMLSYRLLSTSEFKKYVLSEELVVAPLEYYWTSNLIDDNPVVIQFMPYSDNRPLDSTYNFKTKSISNLKKKYRTVLCDK